MGSSKSALSRGNRLLSAVGVSKMLSVPWQPKGDGVDSTAFVMPPDLGVEGESVASSRIVTRRRGRRGRMNSFKTWRQVRVRV